MEPLYDSDYLLLLRLIIAHVIVDFGLQSKKCIDDKNANGGTSIWLYTHGLIVGIVTYLLMPGWIGYKEASVISITHILIDYCKIKFGRNYPVRAFIWDQLIHIAVLVGVWIISIDKCPYYWELWLSIITDIRNCGVLLAYMICTLPLGYLIGIVLDKANLHHIANTSTVVNQNPSIQQTSDSNGMLIGIFERIIILTFVLLGQYEAIGFLITGKSILRFQRDEVSEYIVMGTMLSYALAIIIGVITTLLLQ